jgi:transposase
MTCCTWKRGRVNRYSQFCERYRRYALNLKRSMRQIHRAGEKLFVDYAGPTLELADGSRAHIFVAAMGASSYTYACATPRETMADWLQGCAKALSFMGGVPQLIVPDNPRAMIANPNRYEPRVNETVADFARHYGTSVLPARPRHPQDKARVESAVQVVERWILMRLRHQRFASVDEVNETIEPLLQRLNSKAFQKLPGSRASAFADLDAPALKALPQQPWEWAAFRSVRVHIDHHVEIGAGHGQVHTRQSHSGQWPRPDGGQHCAGLGQSAPRACAQPRVLPVSVTPLTFNTTTRQARIEKFDDEHDDRATANPEIAGHGRWPAGPAHQRGEYGHEL